jgi:hypothetical protein
VCRFFSCVRIGQTGRIRLMAFITIADTGLISYVSTRNLAERWGFGALSWLYPLCLDAVAAVGMDLWISGSPAKRAAARLTLAAVSLSLAANIADWLYVGVGAAVLGAVPPLMLAALLLTMHVHSSATADHMQDRFVAEESSAAPSPAQHVPLEAMGSRTGTGPIPDRPDEELVQDIRDRERHEAPMSKRRVMSEYKVGNDRALRLLHQARNGHQLDLSGTGSSS